MTVRGNTARNWFLHRVSGAMLFVGLAIHFWALHYANGGEVTYREVMSRLTTPLWKTIDGVLLALALYHALLGVRLVLLDLRALRRRQTAIVWGLTILGLILFAFGLQILFLAPAVDWAGIPR